MGLDSNRRQMGKPSRRRAGSPPRTSPLETIADQALELEANGRVRSEGTEIDGHICFPLSVGDATVGVVGVDLGRETGDIEWRRSAGAAAALLAIAVRNVQLVQEVQEHGAYDGLTGCFNRAHVSKVLDSELQRANRAKSLLAMIMLDLDHFKAINDHYGYLEAMPCLPPSAIG